MTAFTGLAFTTTVRVVDRVHHHTANGRANTHPALDTGFTQLTQAVLFIGDLADGGAAGLEAGGDGDYAFAYLNVRMGRGRSEATQQRAGETLLAVAKAFFAPLMASRHIGITLQIDVGQEVFDAKHSTLHPLFTKV